MDEKRKPRRPQGCHNCAFGANAGAGRVLCEHEVTPMLRANQVWPQMFCDDVCGYWTKDGAK
jgi:hypothetical protein